jgi:hypothetical protein
MSDQENRIREFLSPTDALHHPCQGRHLGRTDELLANLIQEGNCLAD